MTKVVTAVKKLFGLNERGEEVLDTTPLAINTGLNRPMTLEERVRHAVRTEEWVRYHSLNGDQIGSFEEEDDFDMPDVEDFQSPYEENFDHDSNIQQLNAEIKERRRKAQLPKTQPDPELEDGEPRKKSSVTKKKAEAEAEA